MVADAKRQSRAQQWFSLLCEIIYMLLIPRLKNMVGFDEISSGRRGRNRGRIEKSRGRDEEKMGNGLPLGQLSYLGTRIGLRRVSQHPGSGQNFVCPENLVELPATFCRLG